VPVYRKPTVCKDDKGVKYRSNWAVGLTLDVVGSVDEAEIFFLVTDSGDFDLLVGWLQKRGKTVFVIGNNPSRALRTTADHTHIIPGSMML